MTQSIDTIREVFDRLTKDIEAYAISDLRNPKGRTIGRAVFIYRPGRDGGTRCRAFLHFWGSVPRYGEAEGGGFDLKQAALSCVSAKLSNPDNLEGLRLELAHFGIDPDVWERLAPVLTGIAEDGSRWDSLLNGAGFVVEGIV